MSNFKNTFYSLCLHRILNMSRENSDLSAIDWSDTDFSEEEFVHKLEPRNDLNTASTSTYQPDWNIWNESGASGLNCYPTRPDAVLPTRNTPNSAGLNLFSNIEITIPSLSRVRIPTGVVMSIPDCHYGKIMDSSLTWINGLHVLQGVIDSDFRGEISVVLFNTSRNEQLIHKGDIIAQIIIMKYVKLEPNWCIKHDDTNDYRFDSILTVDV